MNVLSANDNQKAIVIRRSVTEHPNQDFALVIDREHDRGFARLVPAIEPIMDDLADVQRILGRVLLNPRRLRHRHALLTHF
jgi:hypothetical protein